MSPAASGDRLDYEVVVIGGGPAGTTAALYATRLGHRTAVFEREGGRHAAVDSVHNVYGVSETVSGDELSAHAADQLREYGGDYHVDPVTSVELVDGGGRDGEDVGEVDGEADGKVDGEDDGAVDGEDSGRGDGQADEPRFRLESAHATVGAERVVFATGFRDVEPPVDGLRRFTGRGLHYCLHCDAYTLGDSPVFVLGHDEHAAHVAMVLLNVTADVDLLLDGRDPEWDESTERQLAAHPVERIDRDVADAFARDGIGASRAEADGRGVDEPGSAADPWLGGLEFADGTRRSYRGGFAMYGREYRTELASDLGCDLTADGAIAVDDRRATSVDGAYAVGDVTHGQNQTAIALADGARAGIALHQDLRRFPRDLDDVDDPDGPPVADEAVPAAPADLRARMRALQSRSPRSGLRGPDPWEFS